jgi:glucose-6-phosphate 1-epimerase
VWNPWAAKAERMPDFGDDEYPGMVCVETANVREDAVTIAPGGEHVLATEISVEGDQ